ncbi:MAG TPA: hypothetical protein GXZ52_02985 [Clostridiales bacterium]|nr:hypothetical protein [Clostridiales bacterium]
MKKISFSRLVKRSGKGPVIEGGYSVLIFLAVCFLAGALAGAFLSLFISVDSISGLVASYIESPGQSVSFLRVFWDCAKFHLCVLFLAGSVFGVVIIPVIVFLRAYLLSCTAAAIMAVYPDVGWVLSIVILGLPALVSMPCLFILSRDAFLASGRLLTLSVGEYRPWLGIPIFKHGLVCIVLLILISLVEKLLIPAVVGLII